jgi:hypothetical protein
MITTRATNTGLFAFISIVLLHSFVVLPGTACITEPAILAERPA